MIKFKSNEKKKKTNNKSNLAELRVVQKNLIFVVGLSTRIGDSDILKKNEYFGKFGKILKVVVNNCGQASCIKAAIVLLLAVMVLIINQ